MHFLCFFLPVSVNACVPMSDEANLFNMGGIDVVIFLWHTLFLDENSAFQFKKVCIWNSIHTQNCTSYNFVCSTTYGTCTWNLVHQKFNIYANTNKLLHFPHFTETRRIINAKLLNVLRFLLQSILLKLFNTVVQGTINNIKYVFLRTLIYHPRSTNVSNSTMCFFVAFFSRCYR